MDSPFGDRPATSFACPQAVNLAQLEAELKQALDQPELAIVQSWADPDSPQLWVSGSVDRDTVQRVLEQHTPNAHWGIPQVLTDFIALENRILSDPDLVKLTAAEQKTLLIGLVVRSGFHQG